VVTEALTLALIGGALGMLVASALFQGAELSSTVGDAEIDFAMRFDALAVAACLLFSCCAGLLDAIVPAVRAVRCPIAEALRTS
jgi:ABC-type lipoprotein release transport system permease subunit